MSNKKKVILYDVFDVDTCNWEDSVTLDDIDKERLSFSEQYDYYTSERDIARKLFKDLLKQAQEEVFKEVDK